MPAAHRLNDAQRQLVADYRASLAAVGQTTHAVRLWCAKAFCAQVGLPEAWSDLSLGEQCALHHRIRTFVGWLMVTGRLAATPEYLVVMQPQLGRIARPHHPEAYLRLTATAAELGFSRRVAEEQWSLLVRAAAMFRLSPSLLNRTQLRDTCAAIVAAEACHAPARESARTSPVRFRVGLESVLFHAGLIDEPPGPRTSRTNRAAKVAEEWRQVPPRMATTMRTYIDQCALTQRPATVTRNESALRELAVFTSGNFPNVESVADLRRPHLEAYKVWLAERPLKRPGRGPTLHRASIRNRIAALGVFFERLQEWGSEDAPASRLLFAGDLPILDRPLPRFLDDPSSARLLRAARADDDLFVRLVVELLARTGMRKGELMRLTVDAVVQIGSAFWLRIPVGKLHTDRYIPLHPQLKRLLDEWLAQRPADLRSNLLFVERGRPIGVNRVSRALDKVAAAGDVGHVTPHQLRHTLATQAINRGMSLEAIATLLGHKTLTMTMVYARIADRTVANEYFAVTDKVEALYDQPKTLPATAEGAEMRRLRAEVHRRMLGNGYCARPVEMDCHFESICESCTFFVTTADFRPTLERQRDDAVAKGQVGRQKIFEGLLSRLEEDAS